METEMEHQELTVKNDSRGCRHSSVESSAPTILPPRVRVPSMPSTLFHLFVLYLSCEKNENKQKEAGFGPFKKKNDSIDSL